MGEGYIYVAVDETGNLGKSLKGERYYTLVACVVNNRKRFEDATRRLGFKEEVKFQTHDVVREKVLRYAAPAVSEIFFVRYQKEAIALNRHKQPDLHLKMLQLLADAVVLRYGSQNELIVEVDHKDGISDGIVRRAFENNEYRMNVVFCEVLDSRESYGLQTNDFFVGAIGRMVNLKDTKYVRMFDSEPTECHVHSMNRKQGEPASTTLVEYRPHGQSLMDSPPGIATEVLIKSEGRPVVRLEGLSESSYLKGRQRSGRLFGSMKRRKE